jgi:hypothetical protein
VQLAWHPYQLDSLVRVAAPHALTADWQEFGRDTEMLLLQVQMLAHQYHVSRAHVM